MTDNKDVEITQDFKIFQAAIKEAIGSGDGVNIINIGQITAKVERSSPATTFDLEALPKDIILALEAILEALPEEKGGKIKTLEKMACQIALMRNPGDQAAADWLGIHRTTLIHKKRKYGLSRIDQKLEINPLLLEKGNGDK